MSGVAAPADRRFRRAHLKPARTRRGWNRLLPTLRYVPVLLVAAYGVYVGSSGVAQARLLRVDRILVRGNERLAEGEVLAVLSGLRGESLVWTDLDGWRQRLLASPWVREAALRRSLPSTVEVTVWERRPIGIGRIGKGMYLVDELGTIIDEYGPGYADLDLPIIDGLATSPGGGVPAADPARAELAARVVNTFRARPEIARRLSQIDVGDLRDAQVILSGDAAVISLGDGQFLERLQNYLELATALRDRVEHIDHVDVRFDKRIYVRPAPGQARGNRTQR
jgi:cell division protein FtsQ